MSGRGFARGVIGRAICMESNSKSRIMGVRKRRRFTGSAKECKRR